MCSRLRSHVCRLQSAARSKQRKVRFIESLEGHVRGLQQNLLRLQFEKNQLGQQVNKIGASAVDLPRCCRCNNLLGQAAAVLLRAAHMSARPSADSGGCRAERLNALSEMQLLRTRDHAQALDWDNVDLVQHGAVLAPDLLDALLQPQQAQQAPPLGPGGLSDHSWMPGPGAATQPGEQQQPPPTAGLDYLERSVRQQLQQVQQQQPYTAPPVALYHPELPGAHVQPSSYAQLLAELHTSPGFPQLPTGHQEAALQLPVPHTLGLAGLQGPSPDPRLAGLPSAELRVLLDAAMSTRTHTPGPAAPADSWPPQPALTASSAAAAHLASPSSAGSSLAFPSSAPAGELQQRVAELEQQLLHLLNLQLPGEPQPAAASRAPCSRVTRALGKQALLSLLAVAQYLVALQGGWLVCCLLPMHAAETAS